MRRDGLSIDTSPCGRESLGSEYFLDSVKAVTTTRWRGRRLLGGGNGAASPESVVDLGHLEQPLRKLSFTEKDLRSVIEDRDDFRSLQSELRRKGAVTNSMLKEGIHFYVHSCLEKRQSPKTVPVTAPASTPTKSPRGRLTRTLTPPRWR